jgi:DNA-binding response OmpR family regulator
MSVMRHRPFLRRHDSDRLRDFGTYEKLLLVMTPGDIRQVKDHLDENFFNVHSVTNAADAVDEIINNDFEAVVVDTGLRNFPFPMFYSAVEKMRSSLLSRFIFLIDSGTDEATVEFIDRVDGLKVWRPIEFRELFQTIEIVQGRNVIEAMHATR